VQSKNGDGAIIGYLKNRTGLQIDLRYLTRLPV